MLCPLLCLFDRAGRIITFKGDATIASRSASIKTFFRSRKAIFLMSQAGALGLTLCGGGPTSCAVMFFVGDVPWSYSQYIQARDRLHRIGQTRPVEIVLFVPRLSILSVKLESHEDGRDRLLPIICDADCSKCSEQDEESAVWRKRASSFILMTELDEMGNYLPRDGSSTNVTPSTNTVDQKLPDVAFPLVGYEEESDSDVSESDVASNATLCDLDAVSNVVEHDDEVTLQEGVYTKLVPNKKRKREMRERPINGLDFLTALTTRL